MVDLGEDGIAFCRGVVYLSLEMEALRLSSYMS